jgi:hypothetical protein
VTAYEEPSLFPDLDPPEDPRIARRAAQAEAERLKTLGQGLAIEGAERWHDAALRWISKHPAGEVLSADDLVDAIGLPNVSDTNRNNAVGACITAAAKSGLIERVGWKKSERKLGHGRVIAVWRRREWS